MPHTPEEERYLSLERVRDGVRILYAQEGGIDIEEHSEKVTQFIARSQDDISTFAEQTRISGDFLRTLFDAFESNFFAFCEINPLVVSGDDVHVLDAAALVDSAGSFFVHGAWGEDDIVKPAVRHSAELAVEALAATSAASFRLSVIDPQGSLFFLFSGGGGSIVVADQAQIVGAGKEIGNYGEYSGGPSREETYLYAKAVVALCLGSKKKKKALVIAGGVANFTDVKKTFLGIIDALGEEAPALRDAGVRVFVRRGGPNEAAGLALMREFLEREKLLGAVYGSETIITRAIDDAITYAV